jgi:hypothetical protein
MIKKVFDMLNPLGYPIKWNERPKLDEQGIVISYHFFNEKGVLYGDGQIEDEEGTLQVDIFSVVDYSDVVKQVKTLLNASGIFYVTGKDDEEELDSNTRLFRKMLIFNYIEGEVI